MHRDGKWVSFETTVCWLEVDPEDETKLIERYERFDTIEERQAHIAKRIEAGLVYDIMWYTESAYGGDPSLFPETKMTNDNGFMPPKEIRHGKATVSGESDPLLHSMGEQGRAPEESGGSEGTLLHD